MEIHNYFGPLQEDMSYVDRIEFVKGPAGFMVGNSEPGGFYNVVTKEPAATDKTGVHLAMGSFGTYRLETDVNRKLSDDGKLLFRLNAMGNLQGSHISYTSYDGYALAPSLKYLFSDKTSLTLQYIYQYVRLEGGFGPYIYSKRGFKDAPRNMSYNDLIVKPVRVNDHSVFATFKHEFSPDWQLTAKLGYLDYRMRGEDLYPIYNSLDDQGLMKRQLQVRDVDNFTRLGQVFLNGKFETGAISHRLLTGLDLGNKKYFADWTEVRNKEGEDLSFNIFDPVYGKIDPDQLPYIDRSRSLRQRAKYKGDSSYGSLYFHDEISFWADRLRLSLGGRYTYSNRLDKNGLELEDNAFTPRGGLEWQLDQEDRCLRFI